MGPYRPIDFSLFKCEVFSPDGALIETARINKNNDFFASSLVPGQKYFLAFSYSDIMIECIEFCCETVDRVVYLSPAHIIHNCGVSIPPKTFINGVKGKIKKRLEYHVPRMRWAKKALDYFIASTHDKPKRKRRGPKHALDAFIESTHEGAHKLRCPNEIIAFKAGAQLAKAVK